MCRAPWQTHFSASSRRSASQPPHEPVERRDVVRRTVQTLVDNQLRPGAEASRADAERAAAQTRLILAQQTLTLAQTTLTRVLGVTAGGVTIRGDALLAQLPSADVTTAAPAAPPPAPGRQAAVDQARA